MLLLPDRLADRLSSNTDKKVREREKWDQNINASFTQRRNTHASISLIIVGCVYDAVVLTRD